MNPVQALSAASMAVKTLGGATRGIAAAIDGLSDHTFARTLSTNSAVAEPSVGSTSDAAATTTDASVDDADVFGHLRSILTAWLNQNPGVSASPGESFDVTLHEGRIEVSGHPHAASIEAALSGDEGLRKQIADTIDNSAMSDSRVVLTLGVPKANMTFHPVSTSSHRSLSGG